MPELTYNIQHVGSDPHIVVNEDSRTPTLVRLTVYREKMRIDVRQIWSPQDTEDFVLTRRGAAIPIEDLDEVIEFLLAAREFIDKRGDTEIKEADNVK